MQAPAPPDANRQDLVPQDRPGVCIRPGVALVESVLPDSDQLETRPASTEAGPARIAPRENWYETMILTAGEQIAAHLGWSYNRGRNIQLAWAWLNLRMRYGPGSTVRRNGRSVPVNFFMSRITPVELKMIVAYYTEHELDPPLISRQLYRKAYERVHHRSKQNGTPPSREQTEREHASRMAELAAIAQREELEPFGGMEHVLEKLLPRLMPAEQRGLESLLSGEPPTDAADRKRRSRARRAVLTMLMPFLEGELMNEPTMAETVTDHEQRLRDIERQVGLPEGGRQAVAAAVEQFLASLDEGPPSK